MNAWNKEWMSTCVCMNSFMNYDWIFSKLEWKWMNKWMHEKNNEWIRIMNQNGSVNDWIFSKLEW